MPLAMASRRRPLLDGIGDGALLDAVLDGARREVRRRVVDDVVGGTVRDRVDEVVARVRGRR